MRRLPCFARGSALACLLGLTAPEARGGGFAGDLHGARALGFAGAFAAQANDPSAIFFNPAGIAFLKGRQLHLGGGLGIPSLDFTGASPYPGAGVIEKGEPRVVTPPAFDYTHQFSEHSVVGVGLHLPFGFRTAWEDPDIYSGRFLVKKADLTGFSITPTVAYRLADRLAVGAGLDIRMTHFGFHRKVGLIDPFTQKVADVANLSLKSATETDFGFNLGVLGKLSDSLSFGVSYRHQVKSDYAGAASLVLIPTQNVQVDGLVARVIPSGNVPATTSITTPAVLAGGLAFSWGDWTAEVDVEWWQWSSFDRLVVEYEGYPVLRSVLDARYDDSFQYRFGLQRRWNDAWTLRGGYFFDQGPAPTESVSPLLPDASRHGVALGATFQYGRLKLELANLLSFYAERSTQGVSRDGFDGTYSRFGELFAVSLVYGF